MKVILFCGGLGMRLRDYSEEVPKPMVPVGNRPVLWHVMKNYAMAGHTDFILCLGHGGESIKRFFLDYEEGESNDFILDHGEKVMLSSDIDKWTITFVDTGILTDLGDRLLKVRGLVEGEDRFFVNYADGLSDLDHNAYLDRFVASGKQGAVTVVPPPQSYHLVDWSGSQANALVPLADSGMWINAGFFIFTASVFDHLEEDSDFAVALDTMMRAGVMFANPYEGFWMPMDTFKEKQHLDAMFAAGDTPWLTPPS